MAIGEEFGLCLKMESVHYPYMNSITHNLVGVAGRN